MNPKAAYISAIVLVLISPIFGIILADMVGYHEPLDIAAGLLGLEESAGLEWTPLTDYTFPGMPDEIGYMVSGLLGIGAIIGLGLLIGLVARRARG